MAVIEVYHGRGYDIGTDTFQVTKRPGRREALLRLNLQVLEDRAFEVDETSLDEDGFLKAQFMGGLWEDSAPG